MALPKHGEVWLAVVDKPRPVVILTRDVAIPRLRRVTVAPITSTIRGLSTEVPVGPEVGLEHESVISCDNLQTIGRDALKHRLGVLEISARHALYRAVRIALDLPT